MRLRGVSGGIPRAGAQPRAVGAGHLRWPTVRRDDELGLGDEVLRLHRDGPPAARGPASSLPSAVYADPDRHRAELAAVAARPIAAVQSSELAEPGSFVTVELCGVPVLVTRDSGGEVRAMHNVCAHRAATLEHRPSGATRVFSCRFHGWSYELDGSLRAVADASLFSTVPCTRGLRAVGCEERHGIVWVTPAPGPEGPIGVRAWLGDHLDDLFDSFGFAGMVSHRSHEFDVACNWKLLTDGFLELYHLKYLHRQTIAPYLPANMTIGRHYGEHLATAIPKNRLVRQLDATPREQWQLLQDLSMPFVLVPGTVLQWQAGHAELFSLRPDPRHAGRTRCRLSLLVPADRADDVDLWDRNWDRLWQTIPGEDFVVAEEVQRNIDAGVVEELQIGCNEQLVADHLAAVDRLLAAVSADVVPSRRS